MDINDRIKRISEMEDCFDEVKSWLTTLEEVVAEYEDLQGKIKALDEYMTSGEWMEDFEADEAGQIPADLKRGVLSEDALFNLLHELDEIAPLFLRQDL